ncbi:MAG: DUF3817 domain-containing protein [Flavobacterium sp.]|nr:MAG: DUF3817 domain-containing protein [Flavobacterium sp.]
MIRFFKVIATLEGVSLLLLLFIAMPLKYLYDMPEMVRFVGMAHGVLFIAYIVMAVVLHIRLRWPVLQFLIICAASIVPFGTFYIEWKYFRSEKVIK